MFKTLAAVAVAILMIALTTLANAAIMFDQNVTPDVIFGSGNANGSFTVDQNNGVELGLRAKQRFPPADIFNSNGDGTYSFPAGAGGSGSPTPLWSFEWSVNTDFTDPVTRELNDLTYLLEIDFDPGVGTNFLSFDPITPGSVIPWTIPIPVPFFDHDIGNNSTGNGGGTEGTLANYAGLLAANNVAQNSWRMDFFDEAPFNTFNPTVDGTYDFVLSAFDNTGQLASTNIQVIVGQGAPPVPVPSAMLLMGTGLLGLVGWNYRKTKKL